MAPSEWIFGLHAVAAALEHQPAKVQELWVERKRPDARLEAVLQVAAEKGITVRLKERTELDRRSGHARHQGVVAQCAASAKIRTENDLPALLQAVRGPPLLLVLDGVQDPHNLGACLRSADAAGVHAVLAPTDRAAGLTPVARKVASGAAETTPFIQVTNLARTLDSLKEQGVWLTGAAAEAEETLYDLDFAGPTAFVLGAEEKGLRRLTREQCDYLARIPMAGSVASLNVSVAAGVLLFEAVRQRMKINP